MKKVGILTFHYPLNYGGVLQAYALRRKINGFNGYLAEIINYVPEGFSYRPYVQDELGYQKYCDKVNSFSNFLWNHCGIRYPIVNHVTGNDYDYYCIGSDQVWNPNPSWNLEEFLLKNIDEEAIRISYATSIGMDVSLLKCYEEYFKIPLSKFKAISVREKSHAEFISQITGKNCSCVVDPTLLLTPEEYEDIMPVESLMTEEYIFLYTISIYNETIDYKAMELANTLSRKYNLPIIHTAVHTYDSLINNNAGCVMYDGVENFLWYIKNASFVVTNSFHGTVLSMNFRKPFYAFHNERMKSRTENLIQTYDIGDRFVTGYKNPDELVEGMDYMVIDEKLEAEKEKSLNFLRCALDIA